MPATCYYASGDNASTDGQTYIPCNTTAVERGGHSACCAPGDMCFTNGLCKADEGQWNWNWRVGCTDPTFSDPSCPDYCRGIESDDQAHLVFQCSDDETWCCATGNVGQFVRNYNFTCCDRDDLTMELGPAVFYGTAEANIAISTLATSAASSIASSTVEAVTTSADTNSDASQSIISTVDVGSFYTSTPTPTQDTTPPSSASVATARGASSKALPIGLGVGIPFGVIIVALVGFLCFRLGQRRSQSPVADRIPHHDTKTSRPPQPRSAYGGSYAPGHEMDGQSPVAEMSNAIPVELEDRTMKYHNMETSTYQSSPTIYNHENLSPM